MSALLEQAIWEVNLPSLLREEGIACDPSGGLICDPRPGHEESNPSFSVSRHSNGVWSWKRFGGDGQGGNAFTLLVAMGYSKADTANRIIKAAGLSDEDKGSRRSSEVGLPRSTRKPPTLLEKATQKAQKFKTLSPSEATRAASLVSPIEEGGPAHAALTERGLWGTNSSILQATQLKADYHGSKGKHLALCGALVFPVLGPDGQPYAVKARNPGTKAELEQQGLERYVYLTAGHSTPAMCSPKLSEQPAQIWREGKLNGVALTRALQHRGQAIGVQGIAGSGANPHLQSLEGTIIYLSADGDTAGQEALEHWGVLALEGGAAKVRVLPQLEEGQDPCDLLGRDGIEGLAQWLDGALEQATPWQSRSDSETPKPPSLTETHPTLNEAALHGLAGHVVRTLEPSTEADPVAVLMTFLVIMGAVFGDRFFIRQGGVHPLRIWVVLVGVSAKGRKGTSWQAVKLVLEQVFPDGWQLIVKHGLSSGEGLIYAVRDAVSKMVKNKEGVLEETIIDQGVSDKRAFIKEEEFGSVLKVVPREGNTLSAVVRQAFDMSKKDTLQVMTKNSPNVATGAHVGILGHIVKDELLRYLEDTETANGFANRFLWMSVKRSKILPFGGNPDKVALEELAQKVRGFVAWAERQQDRELKWSEDGREAWAAVYGALSGDVPGLAGALLARAEANVLRLTGLFAMLDCSLEMTKQHLEAALAVWEYAEDSSTGIFGQRFGDPVADALIAEIRSHPNGLTKTELSNSTGRNTSAARLDNALSLLLKSGRVELFERKADSGKGRPAQVYKVRG